jgi:hypothetical protein
VIVKTTPLIVLLLVFGCAGLVSVSAQARSEAQPPAASEQAGAAQVTSTASDEALDLSITANVTARELRFEAVPTPKVEFTGKPARKTTWEAERENLPRPVEPGVTYRNIGIRLKITSIFEDIDRIVAEALGEVPRSDDPSPAQTQPRQQDAAPPSTPPAQPAREGSPL